MNHLILPLEVLFTLALAYACLATVVRSRPRGRNLRSFGNVGEGVWEGGKTYVSDEAIGERFLLVKIGSDSAHIALCGQADAPVGIATDETSGAGESVNVDILGATCATKLMVANGAIAASTYVVPDVNGRVRALPTVSGTYTIVGRTLSSSAAAGDLLQVAPCLPELRSVGAAGRALLALPMRSALEKLLSRQRNANPFLVMAAPPTVAIGANMANSTILTDKTQYTFGALPDDARITPIACTVPTQSSGNYAPNYISGDKRAGGWGLRFASDAQKIGVYLRDTNANPVLLRVTAPGIKEQWVSLASPTLATSDGTHFYEVTYDFAASAPRILEFYFSQGTQIKGFNWGLSAGSTTAANPYRLYAAPIPDEPKFMVRTDSYGQIPDRRDHFVAQMAEMFGCMNMISSSAAGQGYLAGANSNGHNALQDIADLSVFGSLDILLLAIGYNDQGQSGIQAQATTYIQTAMALHPSAVILVSGPWQTPSHAAATANTEVRAAFNAAADLTRMRFIETVSATPPYQDQTGGNSTLYISVDNTHDNAVGAKALAGRFVQDIVTAANSLLASS